MILPLVFLVLGIGVGWFLNSWVTRGKRISEIKKLRQELTIVSSKTSGLQNQVGRMNQKRGISNLKRRFSS